MLVPDHEGWLAGDVPVPYILALYSSGSRFYPAMKK